jgi:hypothetical protein
MPDPPSLTVCHDPPSLTVCHDPPIDPSLAQKPISLTLLSTSVENAVSMPDPEHAASRGYSIMLAPLFVPIRCDTLFL